MASRTLQILVTAKDNASKELKGLRGKVESMQPAFRKMAAIGTGSFVGLSYGIGKAITAAGEAEKISNNFETTFGDSAGVINDFIGDFGSKFSFVESEMKDGANSIGFQLNTMGEIGKEEGEKITTSLLTAAGGLSDFFGEQMNVEQASYALSKGLAGNRAQLIDMGFNVAVEDIKEMAKSMGMNTDELTKAQEAQAFTALIMEQTTGSVKGLTENIDSYTTKKRAMRKAIIETNETLGSVFLPLATQVLKKITPIIEKIGLWVRENKELTKKIVLVVGAIASAIAVFGTLGLIFPSVIKGVMGLATVLKFLALNPVGIVITAIGILTFLLYKMYKSWKAVSPYFGVIWEYIKEKVTYFAKQLALSVKYWMAKATDFMQDKLNGMIEIVNKFLKKVPFINGEPVKFRFDTSEADKALNESEEVADNHREALKKLRYEFDEISEKVAQAKNETGNFNNELEKIKQSSSQVGDETLILKETLDKLGDETSKTGGKINEGSERLSNMKDKINELKGVMTDLGASTKKAMTESINKIAELQEKLTGVKTEKATGDLGRREELAKAYVDQEQKVEELQAQWQQEQDQEEKDRLYNKLQEEREELERHKSIEIAFENEVNAQRDELRKSDLDKAVEKFGKEMHLAEQAYNSKVKAIQKELNAEMEKVIAYERILEIREEITETFLARTEKNVVESINRQIDYYNELARAISEAQAGKTSAGIAISSNVAERANREIGNINITVNGDISGEELLDKIKKGIMGDLELNTNLAG